MRWATFAGLVLLVIVLLGCGGDGSPPATASAGGAPPVPGGPPAGPPAPGGDAPPPGNPAPETPPPGESPPPGETPPPAAPPGDSPPPEGAPLPGGSPGGPPGGSFEGGGQPVDPNNPNNDPNANPEGTPRRPPPPRTLRDQAYAEFRAGRDVMGYRLLSAHFAVVPAAKNELAQKMAWVPGLMRPAFAPRIGIGVFYENIPLNFKGNPMPIGSSELTTAVDALQTAEAADTKIGGARRAAKKKGPSLDFNERSKGDPADSWTADRQLDYYLGDFGHTFLDALLDRMDAGDYGPVTTDLMRQAARPVQRGRGVGPDGQPPGGEPSPGGEFPGADGGGAPGEGPPGGGRFGGRGGRGGGAVAGNALAGSTGLPGSDEDGDTAKRRFTSRASERETANLTSVKQLSPCILWLGKTEEREDLTKRAELANCDVLCVFQMTLREARTGSLVNNTTTLKIQNLRTAKPLPNYSPEQLINLSVETWRQKEEKGVDPVEREVTKAIEALDKVLKPVPLPDAVTSERAKKRIVDLVAQKPDDPLPIIVEARFYAAKGLMTDAEVVETAKALLGDAGFEKLKARVKEGDKE